MIVGIDDTDSKDGMCTTYLTAVLIEKLKTYGTITGYPLLIRLNPNIKYKTRGNAALAFHIELNDCEDAGQVKASVVSMVEDMAVFSDENTNPGVVFIERKTPQMQIDLSLFSVRAVQDVLEIHEALELLEKYGISYCGYKNKRGLIGALAAAGFAVCGLPDFTFELIAYRERERWGTPRQVDEGSVWEAASTPGTWDTADYENKRIVFAPHSPDPILFGIRGESENTVRQAFSKIKSEPVERHIVYRTNQNTDMHLISARISDVRNCRSYIFDGCVSKLPITIEGGHVIFEISDGSKTLECVAFEPTKGFRSIIRQLRTGDEVTVYGSVKDDTLNIEKIRIISLNTREVRNPLCCGKRMKSMGRGQGYRCEKCGSKSREPVTEVVQRDISPGFYEVPPSARRHLAKPLVRIRTIEAASSCARSHASVQQACPPAQRRIFS